MVRFIHSCCLAAIVTWAWSVVDVCTAQDDVIGLVQLKSIRSPNSDHGETLLGHALKRSTGALRGLLFDGHSGRALPEVPARSGSHQVQVSGNSANSANSQEIVAPRNSIYVRVSGAYLSRLANQSLDEHAPAVDRILGTTVEGTSHTKARTELTLLPNPHHGHAVLRVVGTTSFDVAGQRGRVDIGTRGITHFHGEKTILLEDHKLRTMATQIDANTRLTAAHASTRIPGLRGFVIEGIAERRLAKKRQEAEVVTARHTEVRVARQLDQWVDGQLADIMSPVTEMAALVSRGSSHLPKEVHCRTTSEMLEVVVIGLAEGGAKMTEAPTLEPGRSDVTVHLHSAFVRQALSDPELRPLIQAFSETMLALGSSTAIGDTPTGSSNVPLDNIRWSRSGAWLTLNLAVRQPPKGHVAVKSGDVGSIPIRRSQR